MSNKQIGRLAMRHEGQNWNAYYALQNTMEDAIILGSIRIQAVTNNNKRKEAFMRMMMDIVSDIIEQKTGAHPEWTQPYVAPEHERAGNDQ